MFYRSLFGFPVDISDSGMEFDDSVHACVTKFMIETLSCNCITTKNDAKIPLIHLITRAFAVTESLISGSSAEFYIKPMLSCIGDIDIMHYRNAVIAIPYDQLPPVELLNKYQKIAISNIINTDNPGYVYLREACIYEDGHCFEANAQNIAEFDPGHGLLYIHFNHLVRDFRKEFGNQNIFNDCLARSLLTTDIFQHGPAINCAYNNNKPMGYDHAGMNIDIDIVTSIRCPIWPKQAADWPTRYRDRGWPDQTTINMVVNKACDLVQAVHPSCRDNEWKRARQWRLSFSRAEVTLLNSWTPVQQIVYHMLRYVLKREVFSKTNNNSKTQFSNYHLKTSMLWACEQNPARSWSAESSLVKTCSWMLHKLSDCVEAKHCQHYFISSCNLLDYFDDDSSQVICKRLRSLAYEPVLLSWFVENYIRKSALYCPRNVSILFEDISSSDKLKKAVNAVVDWKLKMCPRERYAEQYENEKMILSVAVSLQTYAAHKLTPMITKVLQHVDQRFQGYFIAAASLHIAQTILVYSLSEEHLESLRTLLDPNAACSCNEATTGDAVGSGR